MHFASGCFFRGCSDDLYPEVTSPRDFEFSLIDNGTAYEVTVGEVTKSGTTKIPTTYNDLPVTSIGAFAFYNCVTVSEIIIPEGIATIGRSAFYNCNSLTEIEIPASVIALGYTSNNALENNYFRATKIHTSQPTPELPEGTFRNCANLKNIFFADESRLNYIGNYAFSGCISIAKILIPQSVTTVGDYAFAECTNLISINFEENSHLKNISKAMFYSCEKLSAIQFPADIETIAREVFFNCQNLAVLTMAKGSAYFKDEGNCIISAEKNEIVLGCKSSVIPHEVTSIGAYAFEGSNLTSMELPAGIREIGEGAFFYCENLTEITISKSQITKIESSTFFNCKKLEGIVLPLSVKEIGQSAFFNCTSLKYAKINGVLSIGVNAFNRCEALSDLILPEGLVTIGYGAFYWCSSLSVINIPSSVKSIGDSAFVGCDSVTEINISKDIENLTIGVYSLSGCKSVTSIVIPYGVISIGSNAFAHCWALRQIDIPSSVATMGSHVFTGCSDLVIYVRVLSKPSGWNEKWNSDDASSSGAERTRTIMWGH